MLSIMETNVDIRQSTSFQVKKWSLFTLSLLGTIITAIVFIYLIIELSLRFRFTTCHSDLGVSYMIEILYN